MPAATTRASGLACAYCGDSVENGTKLTLDHLKPYVKGGSNHESNLVTCCHRCNSARGSRPVAAFAKATAGYLNHGVTQVEVLSHVKDCAKRELKSYLAEAKQLISRRGSAARVLAEAYKKM
jgi:hypothetical protein